MPEKKKTTKKAPAPKTARSDNGSGFLTAFQALLKKRKIPAPKGLATAPPEAYAHQPASVVAQLDALDDSALTAQAERIAGYAQRHAARAQAEWERSPLIAELRRRGLKEPARPKRAVGVSFSLKKPLQKWTDAEILDAARAWSVRGDA